MDLKLPTLQQVYLPMKKTYINNWKMERGCFYCGERRHPSLLDLHHVIPSSIPLKDRAIGRIGSGYKTLDQFSWDIIREELRRCVPLCCSCHRMLDIPEFWIVENPQMELDFGGVQ